VMPRAAASSPTYHENPPPCPARGANVQHLLRNMGSSVWSGVENLMIQRYSTVLSHCL
jgi:hypothetical protein